VSTESITQHARNRIVVCYAVPEMPEKTIFRVIENGSAGTETT
jgi:hypothetical protein